MSEPAERVWEFNGGAEGITVKAGVDGLTISAWYDSGFAEVDDAFLSWAELAELVAKAPAPLMTVEEAATIAGRLPAKPRRRRPR